MNNYTSSFALDLHMEVIFQSTNMKLNIDPHPGYVKSKKTIKSMQINIRTLMIYIK